jgi:hypothetical protein
VRIRYTALFFIVFALILLAACDAAPDPVLVEPTNVAFTSTVTSVPATPTSTPTPVPERALLVAGPSGDGRLEAAMSELASESGLLFEVHNALSAGDLGPEVRVVVIAQAIPGLQELVAAAPGAQFVVIGGANLPPAANLSVIGADGERPDLQGFLAGYLAAVATQDWRVGVLRINDELASRAAVRAFVAGARYFCGLCNPPFPPYGYPQAVELASGSSPAEWEIAINTVVSTGVDLQTLYLPPGNADQAVLDQIAQTRLFLIGAELPASFPRERWIASVGVDPAPALREMWPTLLAGSGGMVEPLLVGITEINASLLSPGRQALVEALVEDLNAGFIDTGVDLATGELRLIP